MRTVVPGSISSQYIQALKENQIEFLKSFTASDETSQRAREAWPLEGIWRPKSNGNTHSLQEASKVFGKDFTQN